jgi:hypothetical protein
MNNLFEDLRINLNNYRNGNFQSFNVLNNLKNYLSHWINQFRGMMPYNFSIPGNWDINLELEDIVNRLTNSELFERRNHRDIVRWVLVINSLINNRLYQIDFEYVPEAPLLWRQDNSFTLPL